MRVIFSMFVLLASASAWAETLYVVDRLQVAVRGDVVEGSAIVKQLESGAAVEVLERTERFLRVRDAQGAEGWVDARFLSAALPARTRLAAADAELAKARGALAAAEEKLKKTEAALAEASARAAGLSGELAAAKDAKNAKTETPPPAPPVTETRAPVAGVLWIGVSFAMLLLGFLGGVWWIRESIRRRMGGMYFKV